MHEGYPHPSLRIKKTGKIFPCRATGRWQRGFTLIEMALAFAVAGVMLSIMVAVIGPDIEKQRVEQTIQLIGGKEGIGQLEQALILFAIRNNRLPCPADGALTAISTSYGLENDGVAPPSGTLACAAPYHPIIPWKTLGLDERLSLDGWGNRITYFPANTIIPGVNTLVSTSKCLVQNTVTPANIRPSLCDPTGNSGVSPSMPYGNYLAIYEIAAVGGVMNCKNELSQPNTNELSCPYGVINGSSCTSVATADACSKTIPLTSPVAATSNATIPAGNVQFDGNRAAYVLISHGRSGWYAWNKAGVQMLPPQANFFTLKVYNSLTLITPAATNLAGAQPNYGFVQGPNVGSWPPSNNASYFDDIVNWRTPAFIIQHCGSLACGNY